MVDKSGERVRKMFGEIAPGYDRMNHLLSMNVDRFWRWRTVRALRPQPGQKILDICTGTGDLAIAFSRYTKGKCEVVGSDFCREMLEIGEVKKQKRNIDPLTFVHADAQSLPFEDKTFDFVSVAFGLRNVADTDRGLSEMVRVARPGGKIAVLEFSMPRRQPIKGFYQFYFDRILPRIGQLFMRNRSNAYEYLPESVGEFPAYEALAERMKQAGMSTVKFYPYTFGVATLYIGEVAAKPSTPETKSQEELQLQTG